jgi:hypothetical protein
MINGAVRNPKDPIVKLLEMQPKTLYDYRFRTDNLVYNLVDPDLNLGETDIVLNGGFEEPYHSLDTVAEHWNFVGNGTPSRETSLPWASSGTSAQRVDNDTRYGNTVLSQPLYGFTHKQTYKFDFKIQVLSGYAQIRIAIWGPWQLVLLKNIDFNDGIVQGTLYFSVYHGVVPALQLRNVGTSTPLTFIVDDWNIVPVQNDQHLILFPYGYDSGAWGDDYYEYAGLSTDCGFNYNREGQLDAGSQLTAFSLIEPVAHLYSIQGFYDIVAPARSFWSREYANKAEGIVSMDGSGYAKYEGAGPDPNTLSRIVWLDTYDGPGGTETISLNGVDYPTSYTLGTHKNPLHQGAGYTNAGYINGGAFAASTAAKYHVAGYFDRVLSGEEQLLVGDILDNLR